MKVMLLAAGLGKRMRPLTDTIPKAMLPVAGKPLIEHHVEKLVAAGAGDIVVNTSYMGQQIRDFLGDGSRWSTRISYSDEGELPLDTGSGVRQALPLLGGDPFLLISADVWITADYVDLLQPLQANDLACLQLVPNPEHNPSGDFLLSGDRLLQEGSGVKMTYAGIGVLHPAIFDDIAEPRFPLRQVLFSNMAQRRVQGIELKGDWCDVGTPERLVRLERQLKPAVKGVSL